LETTGGEVNNTGLEGKSGVSSYMKGVNRNEWICTYGDGEE
jgi:hypothetical protein